MSSDNLTLLKSAETIRLAAHNRMDTSVYKTSIGFCNVCTAVSIVSSIIACLVMLASRSRYPSAYRRHIYVFILFNTLDAIIVNVAYVNVVVWHNSVLLFSDGILVGPRAVGFNFVISGLPTSLLSLLNLFRYAQITNFSKLDFFSSSYSLVFYAFWMSASALFHFALPVILFQADAEALDQTADLFYLALNQGRDTGFDHCIGTYWIGGTFQAAKWKPILGLGLCYLVLISVIVYNVILTSVIRNLERSLRTRIDHSTGYIVSEPRHLLMFWSQFAITFICMVFPRLLLATLPLIRDCTRGNWAQQFLTSWPMFLVPFRPIISNITVLVIVKDILRHMRRCLRMRDVRSASVGSMDAVVF